MPIYSRVVHIEKESLHIEKFKSLVSELDTITAKELRSILIQMRPDISKSGINWIIRQLVKKNVLERVGHGIYRPGMAKIYKPPISSLMKDYYRNLKEAFPYSELCIWETSMLSSFMQHQTSRFAVILETDSDSQMAVLNFLLDTEESVYLSSDYEMIERYSNSSSEKRITIVKPLISEAPRQEVDGISTVTLEKVLVDLFCDGRLYSAYQGNELSYIFKNALGAWTLNQSKLLRYAGRRGRRNALKRFLTELDVLKIEAEK